MDRIAGDARGSADEKNAQRSSLLEQKPYLREPYEALCEVRSLAPLGLNARLSAAGFNDIPEDALLTLAAMPYGPAARVLIRYLGIASEAASQALETLIWRGYLEFRNNPEDARKPTVVLTNQGRAALDQIEAGAIAHRWAEFPFRPGDIVISTAPKSGTTWLQMICALLIFQTPSLPAPLPKLSPWLDERRGCAKIYTELAAQQHRRFIKTHAPLNDIPIDPRVTYIVVARNPLDVAVSWYHQVSPAADKPAGKNGGEQRLESPRQWVLDRIGEMEAYPHGRDSFDTMLKNLASAWERRTEPNVILVHYEDLSADLAGEMRQLAGYLDITVAESEWPTLVQAATFKGMQAAAEKLEPRHGDVSKGQSAFFRRGSSGEGRSLLASTEAALYYSRAAQVAPPDLLTWLHRDN
jgi:aryl sulfotransferase